MGNAYEWRKERRKAEALRRCWRTSISTTSSTCGSCMASETGARRCNRRAIRGRHRDWIPGPSRCRPVPSGTCGTHEEVPPGTASRENAAAGIWTVCDPRPATARSREARDVQLSRLHAHLREEEKQRNVHGAAADDAQAAAGEAERGEGRASAAHARTHPRTGPMVASGGAWTPPVLRSAHELSGADAVSAPSRTALASCAFAA